MKSFLNFALSLISTAALAQSTPLFIPDTISGTNINLTIHHDSVQFFPGQISHTYAFNSNKYLGPTLIINKGSNLNITVNNQLQDTTTIHWHGIHVPAKWDGGPHTPILPGAGWNPQFTVMDHAATYWYHPHTHMKTAGQAIKGAAGFIIVRDANEAGLTLPRRYGIDDFPVVVQVQQYDSLNQAMPLGMQDSTILVNGGRNGYGYSVYANMPAQVVRMRLLNASGERVINFGFSGNMQFHQIASDGGLLNAPHQTTRVRLAPGERAEILLNLTGMNGQTLQMMCYGSELPMGVQGGPTMPMPSGPPMDSPLNGVDYNLMQINVVAQTSNPVLTIPSMLTTNTPYDTSMASLTRTIRFTADSAMVMDGPFYFNGNSFDMMRVDYDIPINSIEVWKLVNETMVAHPFHIHDVQFYLIERSGVAPGPEELGRKDVVLVPPYDSVMFVTKFDDFADTLVPYMFHCHILMHEDDGMMGQFIVRPMSVGMKDAVIQNNFDLFPNPVKDILQLNSIAKDATEVMVYSIDGKLIPLTVLMKANSAEIDVRTLSGGVYIIKVKTEKGLSTKKFVKM